jgi:hypothetical protein
MAAAADLKEKQTSWRMVSSGLLRRVALVGSYKSHTA